MTVEACDPNNKGGSYDNPGIPEVQADYISGISTLRFYFIRMLELEQGVMNGWNLAAVHGMRVATRRLPAASPILETKYSKKTTLVPELVRMVGSGTGVEVF